MCSLRGVMSCAGMSVTPGGCRRILWNREWTALNEAKVVFGGDKVVVALLVELSTEGGQRETHERLAAAMAKASGFSTTRWPAKFIETAIAGVR